MVGMPIFVSVLVEDLVCSGSHQNVCVMLTLQGKETSPDYGKFVACVNQLKVKNSSVVLFFLFLRGWGRI